MFTMRRGGTRVQNGACYFDFFISFFLFFFFHPVLQNRCCSAAFLAGEQLDPAVNPCSTSSYASRSHMVGPGPALLGGFLKRTVVTARRARGRHEQRDGTTCAGVGGGGGGVKRDVAIV